MDLGLRDKLIVISGGASGIGEAISRAALAEGARVAILSKTTPATDKFLAELRGTNASVDFLEVGLEDPEACAEAIAQIETRHGDIFGLVNNAGVNDGVGLASGNAEEFLASYRRNTLHYYVLAHHALGSLKRTRGAIVNIASKVALTEQGNTSGYAAAKGAQLALTREWAVELLPFRIRVNAIVPAEVMTPAYTTWLATLGDDAPSRLERIERKIPLEHRMTKPAEIASAAIFLLSPTQSAHTTGQWLHVDGGYAHLDRAIS